MREDLSQFNWADVREALYALKADTEENEPWAVSFIRAVEEVIDGLPE